MKCPPDPPVTDRVDSEQGRGREHLPEVRLGAGDLGGAWNYEVSANYGQLKERTKIGGNVRTAWEGVRIRAAELQRSRAFRGLPECRHRAPTLQSHLQEQQNAKCGEHRDESCEQLRPAAQR